MWYSLVGWEKNVCEVIHSYALSTYDMRANHRYQPALQMSKLVKEGKIKQKDPEYIKAAKKRKSIKRKKGAKFALLGWALCSPVGGLLGHYFGSLKGGIWTNTLMCCGVMAGGLFGWFSGQNLSIKQYVYTVLLLA